MESNANFDNLRDDQLRRFLLQESEEIDREREKDLFDLSDEQYEKERDK